MRKISDTLARMARMTAVRDAGPWTPEGGRLTELTGFGSNPGGLRGHLYVPDRLADRAALVVVLHGCTQTAAGYDVGAGWSEMADRYGFALLFPEQQRANNPNLCFNWFVPEDTRRGSGEALSIRQMIASVANAHPIDPARIFVTGLSAGGAMAMVMLAAYPEVFAGGAVIAGLPYGCAGTVPEAFDRMRGHGLADASALAARVRRASSHADAWPTLSVWHGTADATVNADNADAIIAQWQALHGIDGTAGRVEQVAGHRRQVWRNAEGREVIESFSVSGMAHGTPLATAGSDSCGRSGPFMLEAGISSTHHICRFWGIADESQNASEPVPKTRKVTAGEVLPPGREAGPPQAGVGAVIENALRAAGLMR